MNAWHIYIQWTFLLAQMLLLNSDHCDWKAISKKKWFYQSNRKIEFSLLVAEYRLQPPSPGANLHTLSTPFVNFKFVSPSRLVNAPSPNDMKSLRYYSVIRISLSQFNFNISLLNNTTPSNSDEANFQRSSHSSAFKFIHGEKVSEIRAGPKEHYSGWNERVEKWRLSSIARFLNGQFRLKWKTFYLQVMWASGKRKKLRRPPCRLHRMQIK